MRGDSIFSAHLGMCGVYYLVTNECSNSGRRYLPIPISEQKRKLSGNRENKASYVVQVYSKLAKNNDALNEL